MKKKLLISLLVAVMLVSAFGCGGTPKEGPAVSDEFDITTVKPEDLKIAVLIPSTPTDGGWGEVGAGGLKFAADHFGVEGVIIEARTADLMKQEAEALASEGFHVIFGHGGQYASPFSEIADEYPNTLFMTAGGNIVMDNLMPFEFTVEQLSYIQGMMAAHLTETDTVGTVVGGEFPAYTKTSRGFELGAKSVNPDIKVLFGVTQDASDMSEGYELTMAQIQAGADIVWSNANRATQGSIAAARETNTLIFGMVNDIQAEAPGQAIATAYQNYGPANVNLIEKYLAGELETGVVYIGVPEGGIGWIWNENVKAQLPAEVVGLYDEILPKIQSGEIYVPGEQEGW